MPTGYTCKIGDGQSFEDFVLGCARAFGACITLRDDPPETPIPEKFEPSNYHATKLDGAKSVLEKLKAMTPAEADESAEREHRNALADHAKQQEKDAELKLKYESMLARVTAWEPPTAEHYEFKRFMRDQIERSIELDTGYEFLKPNKLSGKAWLAIRSKQAQDDIDYHTRKYAEEVARAAGRTAWVQALRDSLQAVRADARKD